MAISNKDGMIAKAIGGTGNMAEVSSSERMSAGRGLTRDQVGLQLSFEM